MQIKRTIEKVPGGLMLIPLLLGALCRTYTPDAGHYFGSFTNGLITGVVPILAVWFFCMGATIDLRATGTVLRKSGTSSLHFGFMACVPHCISTERGQGLRDVAGRLQSSNPITSTDGCRAPPRKAAQWSSPQSP